MQSKNKNDGVQFSTRYWAYTIAKRHLRGTSRPEVFPIGTSTGKNLKELTQGVDQDSRVYDKEGVSPTIPTSGGGRHEPKIAITRGRSTQPWTPGDIAPTVRQSDKDDVRVIKDTKIRRLTPTECERLQGFPDNWTSYGADGEEISDTQRYKCLGNAVTTNVITAIGNKLKESV